MVEAWKFIRILVGVLLVVSAAFSTWFWVTHKLWVPRYVHFLAIGATLVGFWMRWILPEFAPIRFWGWAGDVVSVLIFPTLVYATFVFYGGPAAAWHAREREHLEAWFSTRTTLAPTTAMPPPSAATIAVARALDDTAEVRIVRHSTGLLTFEIEAWTNFEDAGGDPHVHWHTFHPIPVPLTETMERITELAVLDADARGLRLGAFEPHPEN